MPPVAVVYQSRLVPVAVKDAAVVFWQYGGIGLVVGAFGERLTVTSISRRLLSQLPEGVCVT